jgi:hypothetical protein
MYLKIKKAELGKIILEEGDKLPVVYENLTELCADVFYPILASEYGKTKKELRLNVDIEFNPPICADK